MEIKRCLYIKRYQQDIRVNGEKTKCVAMHVWQCLKGFVGIQMISLCINKLYIQQRYPANNKKHSKSANVFLLFFLLFFSLQTNEIPKNWIHYYDTCLILSNQNTDRCSSVTLCWHGLTLIPAWISNYIHYKAWDEITSISKLQRSNHWSLRMNN